MKCAIYALTRQGLVLAKRIAATLDGTVFVARRLADATTTRSFDSLPELVAKTFDQYDGHVFVTAAGIVVRCIAPHIRSKETDPAVICMDQEGRFVISLLSGHLGGGNELATRCAAIVGGQPVVTTATDSAGLPSLDMLAAAKGLVIGNIDRVKVVNSALLNKQTVQIFDPEGCLGLTDDAHFVQRGDRNEWQQGKPGVWVSVRNDCPDTTALRLYPRLLMLGVGCRRGIVKDEIVRHIRNVFAAADLAIEGIGGLASVDAKSDEPGILEAADTFAVDPVFYEKKRLDSVDAPNPSGTVMRRMGVASVSEASALLLSDGGSLLVEKTKTKTVTLAVARRKICSQP